PGVGVIVVGDVAHVAVDVVLAELGGRDLTQSLPHVGHVLGRRRGAVPAPDHHRHLADLALRDPADVVLVKPRRQFLGPRQIASVDLDQTGAHERQGYPRYAQTVPTWHPAAPRPGEGTHDRIEFW